MPGGFSREKGGKGRLGGDGGGEEGIVRYIFGIDIIRGILHSIVFCGVL